MGVVSRMVEQAAKIMGVVDVLNDKEINKKFDLSKRGSIEKEATDLLLKNHVEWQLNQGDGKFYWVEHEGASSCGPCHGARSKMDILMEKVPAKCHFCEGTGIKTVPCMSCHGDGSNADGSKCRTCKGTGKYRYYGIEGREQKPCPNCTPRKACEACGGKKGNKNCTECHGSGRVYLETKGTGLVSVLTSARKVNKTFYCGHCKGSGKAKEPTNPVLTTMKAEEVSGAIEAAVKEKETNK